MKSISAKATKGLNLGSEVNAADNSGARVLRITGVKGGKSRRKRAIGAKIGDWVKVSVQIGKPEMKGLVFDAVIVRTKKPYRRLTGERICFTDNAAILLKDEKGNPKGTQAKGPVAREIAERWKEVSKIASMVI